MHHLMTQHILRRLPIPQMIRAQHYPHISRKRTLPYPARRQRIASYALHVTRVEVPAELGDRVAEEADCGRVLEQPVAPFVATGDVGGFMEERTGVYVLTHFGIGGLVGDGAEEGRPGVVGCVYRFGGCGGGGGGRA